jgi:predicted Zn-dependent peptidase
LRVGEGAFRIGFAPGNAVLADAVARALELCREVDRDGFSSEEIERVRAARLNARPFLADTARKRMEFAIQAEAVGYDRLAATERMATVSVEEASAAYREVLEPSELAVVVVGTAAELRESLEKLGPVEVVPIGDLSPLETLNLSPPRM